MRLVEQQVVEKIIQTEFQGSGSITLTAIFLVDEDADARPTVDGIVIVNVDATYGFTGRCMVNHQAELFLAEEVVIVEQELFDVELREGRIRPADAPHAAVVLPAVNLLCVARFGATERNRVVVDEHFLLTRW